MLVVGALTARGQTEYTVGSSGINQTIPDGNPNGISSQITVSGISAALVNITVSLDITGGYNGDLYAYLLYSDGSSPATEVVLLNRIGKTSTDPFGSRDSGLDVTFSESALTDIHLSADTGSTLTGTYQVDGRTDDPQLVLDTSTRSTSLSSYNGLDPNGTWTLFVADLGSGGGQSQLVNWQLNISAVPEPSKVALGVIAGAVFVVAGRCRAASPSQAAFLRDGVVLRPVRPGRAAGGGRRTEILHASSAQASRGAGRACFGADRAVAHRQGGCRSGQPGEE